MKKAKKIIGILIILFVLFYTETTDLSRTYQESLFTAKGKTDRNNDKIGGYTFRFGGTVDGIEPWKRYRIGYPLGAVTIDHHKKTEIIQGRIQTDAVLLNLIFALIAFVLSIVILKIIKALKTLIDNSGIFNWSKS